MNQETSELRGNNLLTKENNKGAKISEKFKNILTRDHNNIIYNQHTNKLITLPNIITIRLQSKQVSYYLH